MNRPLNQQEMLIYTLGELSTVTGFESWVFDMTRLTVDDDDGTAAIGAIHYRDGIPDLNTDLILLLKNENHYVMAELEHPLLNRQDWVDWINGTGHWKIFAGNPPVATCAVVGRDLLNTISTVLEEFAEMKAQLDAAQSEN